MFEVARGGGVDAADVDVVSEETVADHFLDIAGFGLGDAIAAEPDDDAARADAGGGVQENVVAAGAFEEEVVAGGFDLVGRDFAVV